MVRDEQCFSFLLARTPVCLYVPIDGGTVTIDDEPKVDLVGRESMKTDVPSRVQVVGEGYFDWPEPENKVGVLHGAKCSQCGEVIFPSIVDCPVCLKPAVMMPYDLRGCGTLVDFVIAQRGPAGFSVPYVQAYVKLDDGPTIYSMLANVDVSESGPKAGM